MHMLIFSSINIKACEHHSIFLIGIWAFWITADSQCSLQKRHIWTSIAQRFKLTTYSYFSLATFSISFRDMLPCIKEHNKLHKMKHGTLNTKHPKCSFHPTNTQSWKHFVQVDLNDSHTFKSSILHHTWVTLIWTEYFATEREIQCIMIRIHWFLLHWKRSQKRKTIQMTERDEVTYKFSKQMMRTQEEVLLNQPYCS